VARAAEREEPRAERAERTHPLLGLAARRSPHLATRQPALDIAGFARVAGSRPAQNTAAELIGSTPARLGW
jgi:hypothetical protein